MTRWKPKTNNIVNSQQDAPKKDDDGDDGDSFGGEPPELTLIFDKDIEEDDYER